MRLAGPPSDWVIRFAPLVPKTLPIGPNVLDYACGAGRHTRYFLDHGYQVTAADIDTRGLSDLSDADGLSVVTADLEQPHHWPLSDHVFAGVVVTNYLWRSRLGEILDLVAPGGVLIYETFMAGNERFGRPSDPAFLLAPHELLDRTREKLGVVAFEQGVVASPKNAVVQRIVAVNGAVADTAIPRVFAGGGP